ncbi:MAG: NAD-dependent epimerase/dehydratase family protein [Planctomycetia bacterium]|nr:NAD-dependent epimerase/dehydratase family protein [Planctomycetia bacterium]
MNILVTGGGGFLGENVVTQLVERGERVRVFCRGDYPHIRAMGVDLVRGDLRDAQAVSDACRGMDVVFHTAGLPGISVWRKPFYETNVVGTKNILAACFEHKIRKLIYTSSPSVTDGGKPQLGVDESTPYPKKHLAWYPETKAIAERMVLAANGKCDFNPASPVSRDGLLTCSIRPHLLWGSGDRQLVPRLIERAKSGRLAQVGDGTNLIDIAHVENAAKAHLLAMDALEFGSPVAASAYYISQGEPVNCWQWVNRLLAIEGLPPVAKKISFQSAWNHGAVFEAIYKMFGLTGEPPMTRFLSTQLAQSYWFDISKARRELGYEAFVSTEEGIRRMIEDKKKSNSQLRQ